MTLDDLRVFVAVARAGSFTGAARGLGVPKATVSRRVAAFERDLGVPLLHRSTRRSTLTEAGERLLVRAAPLLDELQSVGDEIQSLQHEPSGRLRIQMPLEFLADELAVLLAEFAAAHPGLAVQCTHYVGAALVDPEDFDLTLLCYELRLPSSEWIARPLMSLRQSLFAAPALADRIRSLDALATAPAITGLNEPLWHFRVGGETRTLAVRAALELDSPSMRLRAAEYGAGIVKAPMTLAEPAVAAGTLVPVPLPHEPVALSVAMLYRSRTMPAKVRVFMDFLQSRTALRTPALERISSRRG